MNRAIVYIRMTRPKQLLAIFLVYSWGILLAISRGFDFSWSRYNYALIAALVISMSVHIANEYADVETDRLTTRTYYSGGSGALPESGFPPSMAKKAYLITGLVGGAIAIWGVLNQIIDINSLAILAIALIFGWGYSIPPMKLAWRGWGELDNALLGGVLLPIYGYFTLANQLDFFIVGAVIPFGILTFNNLLATTWADKSADAQVGKFTLATKYPPHQLKRLYIFVVLLAITTLLWLSPYPEFLKNASLIFIPFSICGYARYTKQQNPAPSVFAMVTLLLTQIIYWGYIVLMSS